MSPEEKSAEGGISPVPPFWRRNPAAWLQLEAQFTLAGVMADATKFNHALIRLDDEIIGFIADMLEECSYIRLKEQLIRRHSISEEEQTKPLGE